MTQKELDQADIGVIGVPPSMDASPTRMWKRMDSFRPKGGRSYLVG
jgi:hypothetical protein